MRDRLKSLTRLAALYELVEHANGVTLDQTRRALLDVEEGIRVRTDKALRLAATSGQALRAGELGEWLIDQSELEFTSWNADALEGLRQQREAAMREAAKVYQASRMQLGQMQSVVDKLRSHVESESERTEQRESDDRYLSRQRWQSYADRRRGAHANGVPECEVKGQEQSA